MREFSRLRWRWTPIAAAGLAMLFVRVVIGFGFPIPWPDETLFVSPAFTLAHDGTLYDPSINPDRMMMWMPPGYMILLAGLFDMVGYGFSTVRWVSTACVLASLGIMAWVARALATGRSRNIGLAIVGVAFLSPYVLLSGNVARMDAMLGALALLGLAAGIAGRCYVMAAIVSGAALVHFNAVYFVPAILVDLWRRRATGRLARPGVGGTLAMAATALCLAAYGLLVATHLFAFLADMHGQFHNKAEAATSDLAHPMWVVAIAGLLAILRIAIRDIAPDRRILTAMFGAGFVVMAHGGHEIWYDYGQPLGFALIAIAWLPHDLPRLARFRPIAAALPATVATLLLAFTGFRVTNQLAILRPYEVMLTHDFIAPGERAKVRSFIATLHRGDTVNFQGGGVENFFLADLARVGARWTTLPHSPWHPYPLRHVDWFVACDSRTIPPVERILEFDLPPHVETATCHFGRADPPR